MVLEETINDIIIENLNDGWIFFVMDFFKEEVKDGNEDMPFIIAQLYCEIFLNKNDKILDSMKNNIFRRTNLDLKNFKRRK